MNRIKEIRKRQKISQDELANVLNMSRQAVSHYERGDREPKLATWQKMADFFDVDIGFLQGITNIRKVNALYDYEHETSLKNLKKHRDKVGADYFEEELNQHLYSKNSNFLTPLLKDLTKVHNDKYGIDENSKDFNFNENIHNLEIRNKILEIFEVVALLGQSNYKESLPVLSYIYDLIENTLETIITANSIDDLDDFSEDEQKEYLEKKENAKKYLDDLLKNYKDK
ncbi:helix-turn-helix transcriptional regulator [Fructobacillus evanidus]|uniref:helix-turn-helix domain-containing protein n=1 Tax=Fructobacillus evanidus TaxID=3064281 RepID=UPI0030C7B460